MALLDTIKNVGSNIKTGAGAFGSTVRNFFTPTQSIDPTLVGRDFDFVGDGGVNIGGRTIAPPTTGLRTVGTKTVSTIGKGLSGKSSPRSAKPTSKFGGLNIKSGPQSTPLGGIVRSIGPGAGSAGVAGGTAVNRGGGSTPQSGPAGPQTSDPTLGGSGTRANPQDLLLPNAPQTNDPTLGGGQTRANPSDLLPPQASRNPFFNRPDPIIDPITGQTIFSEAGLAQAGGVASGPGTFFGGAGPVIGDFGGGRSSFLGLGVGGGVGTRALISGEDDQSNATVRDLSRSRFVQSPLPAGPQTLDPTLNSPLQIESGSGPINAGDIDPGNAVNQRRAATLSLPEALASDDVQATFGALMTQAQQLSQTLQQQSALPVDPQTGAPNGVEDTAGQEDFLNQFSPQERGGIQGQLDNVKISLGLPQLLENRVAVQSNINAITETFTAAIEDIKSNPDLPKGLAARRITALSKEQNASLQQLLNQLQITEQQIDDVQDEVDRQFGIIKFEEDRANQQTDNNRQMLNLLIGSGAISGFSDDDIQGWSEATGIPAAGLQSIRAEASKPDIEIRGDANNGFTIFDKDTGKVVNKISGQGGQGGGSTTGKRLSTVDVQRLIEQNPGAGIQFGDTEAEAIGKIQNSARTTAQVDIRTDIAAGFTNFGELAQAYPELTSDEIVGALGTAGVNQSIDPTLGEAQGGFFNALFRRNTFQGIN